MEKETRQEAFDKSLKTFVRFTNASMKAARDCANMAIQQFAEHGDLSLAQRFYEAMPKNYSRRAAFLKWLQAHSPVTMVVDETTKKKVLVKDKTAGAVEFAADKAIETPFWDFAPDREQVLWAEDDVVVSLERVLKKYHKDNYQAKSDAAKAMLAKAEAAVKELKAANA